MAAEGPVPALLVRIVGQPRWSVEAAEWFYDYEVTKAGEGHGVLGVRRDRRTLSASHCTNVTAR